MARMFNFGSGKVHYSILSDFILGCQDGIVNVLGIILGVSAATTDIRIIFVAALAALGAESISMGAVAYTSTAARLKEYKKAVDDGDDRIPKHSLDKITGIFRMWGYKSNEAAGMAKAIGKNERARREFLLSFEHKMAPMDESAPLRSFVVVISATALGSFIPLIPFIFIRTIGHGIIASVALSGLALFGIGYYEAKKTLGSLWRSGLKLAIIGLVAGFAGYIIGYFVGKAPL